jgi:Cft2 family RNA processing exonuclease
VRTIRFEELTDYLKRGVDFLLELGEQAGIGSSSLLIRKCGKTILIDRGIAFEGNGPDKITTYPVGNNLEGIRIDIIILSHIHADHSGLIVPVVIAHPEARVIFSRKTLAELRITLADSLKIYDREAKKCTDLGLTAPEAMFSQSDVVTFFERADSDKYTVINTDEYDVWLEWKDWPDWKFGFTFSGHTHGSFMSFIISPDGDGIVATGDVCGHDQETTTGVLTVTENFLEQGNFRDCKRIIVITEATNGNRDREESSEEMDARLKAVLTEAESRGGMALLPVFAVNRGPNMVAKIIRLGFKVVVAGMVRDTVQVEIEPERLQEWLSDGSIIFMENGEDYRYQMQRIANGDHGFRAIITSSATLDQGASVSFAINMLPIRENVLISTGHRFEGSAMKEVFQLKDRPIERGRTIVFSKTTKYGLKKEVVNVRADVHHFDYTAHAYRRDLVTLLTNLDPDLIFVKHCTEDGFFGLKAALSQELGESCPPVNWVRHLQPFEL